MKTVISPFLPKGSINPPSSKSYCHRYLLMAFIANQKVTIKNFNFCDDTTATINAIKVLGGEITIKNDTVTFLKRKNVSGKIIIDVNQSASTLRMIIPLALYLYEEVYFIGYKELFTRPLDIYFDIFDEQNISYELNESSLIVKGKLELRDFYIRGDVSSQFISGLLFLLAYTKSDKKIILTTPLVSKPFIDMSLDVLQDFGYVFENNNDQTYQLTEIKPSEIKEVTIESDYSAISNFLVLGALKGTIQINNTKINSKQGDGKIIEILKNIGADINESRNSIIVKKSNLVPFDVDITNCIDLGPILFVLASSIEGESIIRGYKNLLIKESNRLQDMLDFLASLGLVYRFKDEILILKGKIAYKGLKVAKTSHDHRLAMAMAICGIVNDIKIELEDSECVNKSYPRFFVNLEELRR